VPGELLALELGFAEAIARSAAELRALKPRWKRRSNSMVAWFSTLTKPPMLGACMPNSLNGKVIEPTVSIRLPSTRPLIGMVTGRVVP
jgi:hypothetical protein